MKTGIIGLAFVAAGVANAADAPAQANGALVPTSPWQVVYDDWACSIYREYALGDKEVLFTYQQNPLTAVNSLKLGFADEHGRRMDGRAKVAIDGQPTADDFHYNIFDVKKHRVREILVDLDKVPLAETTSSLRFELDSHGEIELPVPGFQDAWKALGECMNSLYTDFGVDMRAQEAMATPPTGKIHDFFDPPGQAPVDFAFFYWVDRGGSVDNCRLVLPSRVEKFDEQLCDQIIQRAALEPARDADGNTLRVAQFKYLRIRRQEFTTTRPIR